jgi:MSHA biogenesis protein MshO
MKRAAARRPQRGVTLVELVVVMTIVALVSSIAATLVSRIASSQQANRERLAAALAADVQLGRVADDLHKALPNSLRLTSNAAGVWIEWVPVTDGGRYRAAADTVAADPGDTLDLEDAADTSFDVIGTALATLASGAQLVVQNLGLPEADAYAGNNRRGGLVLANAGRRLQFTAGGALPQGTDTRRFFIVASPVTMACEALAGGGFELVRYSGYGWLATQPDSAAALAGATRTLLQTGVTACAASYSTALANIGALTLRLALGGGNAPMQLLQLFALDNTP